MAAGKNDGKAKLDAALQQIEAGVQEIFQSNHFQDYLNTMAKFHQYSLNNSLLIFFQKPDASLVAGYRAWENKFHRHVRRGEKGIQIIGYAPKTIEKEVAKTDSLGRTIYDAQGQPVMEKIKQKIPAFKPMYVFDVSQTEGEPLPLLEVHPLTGGVEGYQEFFSALEQVSPVPIGFEQIASGAYGYYEQLEKRIAVQEGLSQLQTVKTLIHEIAHAKLHDINLHAGPEERANRPNQRTREIQAESVAYVVCQHYGLDTSDYSFGYIASWSSGQDVAELKASLDLIRSSASELIGKLDGYMQERQTQREAPAATKSFEERLSQAKQRAQDLAAQKNLQPVPSRSSGWDVRSVGE